jgi:Amt family ammonium transporter
MSILLRADRRQTSQRTATDLRRLTAPGIFQSGIFRPGIFRRSRHSGRFAGGGLPLLVIGLLLSASLGLGRQSAAAPPAGVTASGVTASGFTASGVAASGVAASPDNVPSAALLSAQQNWWSEESRPANNAFVLVCSAMVLLMVAPGLAMFYGGQVRKKNVLSIMMQCLFLMSLMSLLWAAIGYSLAFGTPSPWFPWSGGSEYAWLRGVSRQWVDGIGPVTPMHEDGQLTRLTHMLFQGMLFLLAPAVMCGAFAERMKFSAMALFCGLWGLLVYCPIAHWMWGGGWLSYGPGGLAGGGLDFAGGTVVHVSSGLAALMAAAVIGPRLGYPREPMPPHNLTYTALGAGLLWFGWTGFNAGSQLGVDALTTSIVVVTHLAAAAGAIGWCAIEWFQRGKPTVLGVSSGIVAGLVCITPAAGYVNPMPAMIMGFSAGIGCYFGCSWLKHRLRYDDSLDAFGIHGLGGIIGSLLTGLFATRACSDLAGGQPLGLLEGGSVMTGQLASLGTCCCFVAVASLLLLKLIDWSIGLRVPAQQERQGLDIQQHGEEGYIFL